MFRLDLIGDPTASKKAFEALVLERGKRGRFVCTPCISAVYGPIQTGCIDLVVVCDKGFSSVVWHALPLLSRHHFCISMKPIPRVIRFEHRVVMPYYRVRQIRQRGRCSGVVRG